jgi:hypothetical protein
MVIRAWKFMIHQRLNECGFLCLTRAEANYPFGGILFSMVMPLLFICVNDAG